MSVKEIEKSLITRYRSKLYRPFTKAIAQYELVSDNDKIAVCISGGKDSLILAKLFQELKRHSKYNIDLEFLVMDPGYTLEGLDNIKMNCERLGIPIKIKESNIFNVSQSLSDKPCYLCARMRRGFLYNFAQEEGCNKIALGHHMDDVIETTLLNIFYTGTFKTMVPKAKSTNYENMELIRPLVYIKEQDIINFMKYHNIEAMSCGCPVEKENENSKRYQTKMLIKELKKGFKDIDKNIYKSAENINLNRVLGYEYNDEKFNFNDLYSRKDYK